MKSKDSGLSIQRFENVSGTVSYRVFGYLHGERVRRNFKTREEAAAEKTALEIRAVQVGAGHRPQLTSLSEAQVREAESAFQRLAGKPHALSFYVDFALANYRPPETAKRLKAGITDYLAAKKREMEQDQLSAPQYGKISWELKRLEKRFKNPDLREYYEKLSKEELIRKLMLGKMQRSEYTNGRNAEIRAWVEEHPDVKERIEQRIRNVPPQNRERAFINAAKTKVMNQTVRRNGNGIRP